MAVPNMLAEVEKAKAKYPQDWKDAHTGNSNTDGFILKLAADLHAINPLFGNNGKRGNPEDISDDAINYKGEGADVDPTAGNAPRTVIDVIGNAGTSEAFPQWAIVTNPAAPVGAAWVQPGAAPEPPAHVCFVPRYEEDLGGDAWFRANIGVPLQADMTMAGQPCLNEGSSVWYSRSIHDIFDQCVKAGQMVDRAPIVKKHRNEWRGVLGLPPL